MVLRLFMLASAVAFGWVAWRRLARDLPAPAAAVGVGFALLSIEIQGGTMAPVSDLLFGVVLWVLFLVADSDERWSARRTVVVIALGFALVSVRLAGAAIGPALFLFGVIHWHRHGTRPFVGLATWGAAALVAFTLVHNPYGSSLSHHLRDAERKLHFLVAAYRYALFDAELYPFGRKALDQAWHILATVLMLTGGITVLRRLRCSLVTCFLVAYAIMLVVVRQSDGRFLWPMLPLVGAAIAVGLTNVVAFLHQRNPGPHPPAFSRLAVGLSAVLLLMALGRELGATRPFAITGTPDSDALYAFLRVERARGLARAMYYNPRVLTLYSGVPAMGVLDRTTPGQMMAIDEEHLTHVVWQRRDVSNCLQRILNAVPERYPGRFDLVFENRTFRVYRVRAAATPFVAPYAALDWRYPPTNCDAT